MTDIDRMTVRINEIIEDVGTDRENSLAVLQEIQHEYNYLPRTALEQVSDRLHLPLSEVYHIATFYRHFTLQPKGEFCIRVCMGTACHVNGATRTLEEFERRLEIQPGECTPDGAYTLEATGCLGACAQAPFVMVNEEAYPHVSAADVAEIVETCRCALAEQE